VIVLRKLPCSEVARSAGLTMSDGHLLAQHGSSGAMPAPARGRSSTLPADCG